VRCEGELSPWSSRLPSPWSVWVPIRRGRPPTRWCTRARPGALSTGRRYRTEVPDGWNGTLVLWSHAAYRFGFSPTDVELTNNPATRQWLLEHGYAVAASKYQPSSGWVVQQALEDQTALLDWFTRTVGAPRRVVAEGASTGGLVWRLGFLTDLSRSS
jgi:hypothetical protein